MARGPESLALELRRTLLEERAESFLRVRHREQAILQLAFEGKAFVHRHLGPLRHGSLDETDRPPRVLRVGETGRERHRLLPELRFREDAVEQTPVEGLLRGDHAPRRHEVDRAALSDEPWKALGASGPREDAERDLRQAHPPGAVGGDAQIRRHRDFKTATDAVAVDRGDEEFRSALHFVQRLLAVEAEHRLVVGGRRGKEIDVRARGPDAVQFRREHAHVDVVVETDVVDHRVEVSHQVGVVRVRLRLVHPRDGDAVLLLERNVGQVHRTTSSRTLELVVIKDGLSCYLSGSMSRMPQRLVNRIRERSDAHARRPMIPAPTTIMPNASDPLIAPTEYNQRESARERPKRTITEARRYSNAREDPAVFDVALRANLKLPRELRIVPFLVEQELFFHEVPVPALHVPVREDRSEVVDVRAAFSGFPTLHEDISADVVREIHVTDPGRLGSGHPIVTEFGETANAEEPPIRKEDEIVFGQSVSVLAFLGQAA